jgi:hypothetical protein
MVSFEIILLRGKAATAIWTGIQMPLNGDVYNDIFAGSI